MDHELRERLKAAYESMVGAREARELPPWKLDERRRVLRLLQEAGCRRLLEVGSGPGTDAAFFRDNGLDVVCTDLSPGMVAACRSKGLEAHEMDLAELRFPPGSFDAVYAMNCLLHVPKVELDRVLHEIERVVRPDGLVYIGIYGGVDSEGVRQADDYRPKRFFSLHTDDGLRRAVDRVFDVVSFRRVDVSGSDSEIYFHAVLLRRRTAKEGAS